MEFRILNDKFQPIDTLDLYSSFIWTARFVEAGDFELYTPVNMRLINAIKVGYYVFSDAFYNQTTDRAMLMIIESIEITSDPSEGNKIKVTGRDLKSIFDRRIVWGQREFKKTDNLLDVITAVVNENVINPQDWSKTYSSGDGGQITVSTSGAVRRMDDVIYEAIDHEFPAIDGDYQYNGETIYDILVELCGRFNLGWEILYDFGVGKFVFKLKPQVDHTYDQVINNPLIFSPSFENIKNSNYIESGVTEKNAGLIIGEGDEYNVMYNVIGNENTGLTRKEMSISASDISRTKDDGTEYGNRTYLSMILEKGQKEIEQNFYTQTYEGTAEASRGYQYLVDYDIGDICEIINEWGISSKVLISEVVYSIATDKISIIPTFSAVINSSEEGGE